MKETWRDGVTGWDHQGLWELSRSECGFGGLVLGTPFHLQSPAPLLTLQFWLTMSYLSKMTEEQTLVMYSGHPLGLFPSSPGAPRLVITNGMVGPRQWAWCLPMGWAAGEGVLRVGGEERQVLQTSFRHHILHPHLGPPALFQVIPNYSSRTEYEKLFALGVTM